MAPWKCENGAVEETRSEEATDEAEESMATRMTRVKDEEQRGGGDRPGRGACDKQQRAGKTRSNAGPTVCDEQKRAESNSGGRARRRPRPRRGRPPARRLARAVVRRPFRRLHVPRRLARAMVRRPFGDCTFREGSRGQEDRRWRKGGKKILGHKTQPQGNVAKWQPDNRQMELVGLSIRRSGGLRLFTSLECKYVM